MKMKYSKLNLAEVRNIDGLVRAFLKNIDWIDYENIDDVKEVKIAEELNRIYENSTPTVKLLKTAKAFKDTKAGDRQHQGRLILEAMATLSSITALGLPSDLQ